MAELGPTVFKLVSLCEAAKAFSFILNVDISTPTSYSFTYTGVYCFNYFFYKSVVWEAQIRAEHGFSIDATGRCWTQ